MIDRHAARTLAELFEARVASTPESIALCQGRERVSCRELDTVASRYCEELRARDVGTEDIVAISIPRSVHMVAAALGVLKSGAGFMMVDPQMPATKLSAVLAPCAALIKPVPGDAPLSINISDAVVTIRRNHGAARPSRPAGPLLASACAIFHTSGTAGEPNWVILDHIAALSRLAWMWSTYPFDASDVAFVHRPQGLIGFLWDCFGSVLKGVPTVLASPRVAESVDYLIDECEAGHVTRLSASPSLWSAIVGRLERHPGRMRQLRLGISAGEPLTATIGARWYRAFPTASLLNVYGATEFHTPLAYEVPAAIDLDNHVPAGTPITGAVVRILDEDYRDVEDGAVAELFVGGSGLARCYLNAPALTAERFVSVSGSNGEQRLFRTGDMARRLPGGAIDVLGRKDTRLKVRGLRIEPVEIERELDACPAVRRCLVSVEGGESSQLVAFIQADEPRDWRSWLKPRLGEAFVPSVFVHVNDWPLTPGGKTDRAAVRQLYADTRHLVGQSPTGDVTQQGLGALILESLPCAKLDENATFEDAGGDSLSAMRVVARIQDTYCVEVSREELLTLTVKELGRIIDSRRKR